jgi:N-hydroxyarylamine O-acetyltransferase
MEGKNQLPPDHHDVFTNVSHKNYQFENFVPNIAAFCERIKYSGPLTPTLDVLESLQFHFILTFPFENLSIHGLSLVPPPSDDVGPGMKKHIYVPVSVDPALIEEKMLRHGRGGYCAEMTNYFSVVLRTLGFTVVTKSARVLWNYPAGFARPRTHLLTLVWIENTRYLVDVAFGGNSPPMPLRLDTEEPQECLFDTYRIISLPAPYPSHHKLLQVRRNDAANRPAPDASVSEWIDMYFFDEHELSTVADWEQANFQLSLFPNGLFTAHVLIGFTTLHGRVTLFDNKFVFKRLRNNISAETKSLSVSEVDPDTKVATSKDYTVWQPYSRECLGRSAFEMVDELEITSLPQYVDILRNRFGLHIPDDRVVELSIPGTAW